MILIFAFLSFFSFCRGGAPPSQGLGEGARPVALPSCASGTNPCTILLLFKILLLFTILPLCTVLTLITPVYTTLLTNVHCKILTLVQLHRQTRLRICSNYEDRLSRPKVSRHAMLHLHGRFFDCHLTTTCCI